MIEKQSEYLQKLPIEPTVANPVYTNGQTEETKHVEEASSSVCLDGEELEMDDIDSMWTSGSLGDSSPEVLLNTVWFLLTLHMGMRGRDEHYKLTYDDFCIHSTPDGFKYVEFNERDTKTRSGETNASRQFKPKMWNTPNNISRCPLRIFEKFLQKRPVEMCNWTLLKKLFKNA